MRVDLKVLFVEKDVVKVVGVCWDVNFKVWYVVDVVDFI